MVRLHLWVGYNQEQICARRYFGFHAAEEGRILTIQTTAEVQRNMLFRFSEKRNRKTEKKKQTEKGNRKRELKKGTEKRNRNTEQKNGTETLKRKIEQKKGTEKRNRKRE